MNITAYNCTYSLKNITIQENSKLREIKNSSFLKSSIESIFIPSSVDEIQYRDFENCMSLKSITFGKECRLKVIVSYTFI